MAATSHQEEHRLLLSKHIGSAVLLQEWRACKGSTDNTRGYTCGLWMVLHSLAARSSMAPHAGREYLDAVRCPF